MLLGMMLALAQCLQFVKGRLKQHKQVGLTAFLQVDIGSVSKAKYLIIATKAIYAVWYLKKRKIKRQHKGKKVEERRVE